MNEKIPVKIGENILVGITDTGEDLLLAKPKPNTIGIFGTTQCGMAVHMPGFTKSILNLLKERAEKRKMKQWLKEGGSLHVGLIWASSDYDLKNEN